MIEKCRECGHAWGVTTTPRTSVLCGPCARPTPSRRAAHYWWLRAHTGHWDLRYRSPEWWDQQTSIADLRCAAEYAATAWPEEVGRGAHCCRMPAAIAIRAEILD
ncbi:hypothetical protein [Streptomyces asiaticus]|uniref:hypothetical protein n=1 Tax=Streptomyces asiaticus TaxID=114695 RepID=UPI001BA769DC|nr:hypothetical protein [Streptomyces asiaticus]